MAKMLESIGDRMLAVLVPKARAGACPCRPGDTFYQYRCVAHLQQRRKCTDKCDCSYTCGAWQNTFTIC
ncbi:hypothetical protein [Virgisporangium aurantiacum]|uniref:Uncharacterized protein n=1 Tax=Virgisporangium aurantiacum TaxID=175570 RepID=A0A8J4DZT5_9ACTN|nr:hypothetical protein [Virgisporangium aurantiacum]GIJ56036.1 hypothetical protein Vau01_035520 [Virgisporangium aurantiacum]